MYILVYSLGNPKMYYCNKLEINKYVKKKEFQNEINAYYISLTIINYPYKMLIML